MAQGQHQNKLVGAENVPTRQKVYQYCKEFFRRNLYFPTVRNIRDAVGLKNESSVFHHLKMLERDGKIRRASDEDRLKVPYVIVGAKVIYEEE